MQFEPKSERQIQEERCVPEGVYDFEVIAAEDKRSSKGNDMIEVVLNIFKADGGSIQLTDYLIGTPKMAWKLRHFCDSVGILDVYESGQLNAYHCRGVAGQVRVVQEDDVKYGVQNKVRDYVCQEPGTERKVVQQVEVADDIPF